MESDQSIPKFLSRGASLVVILTGSLVLIGWALGFTTWQSLLPSLPKMTANTALGLGLAGASLWLQQREEASRRTRRIAQMCAFVVLLLGSLTLGEYLFGWDLGIDQLLFKDTTLGATYPGRPSPHTALILGLIGMALLLLEVETRRGSHRPAQFLALIAVLIPVTALIGYVYRAAIFYGITAHTGMAVHTATACTLLSLGILLSHPERGLISVLTSDHAGGVMARRLLLATFVFPVLLGWLRMAGEQAGLLDAPLGASLLTLSSIVVFVALIWATAASLNRVDSERKRAEVELRRHRDHLEVFVAERTAELGQAVERLRLQSAALEAAANGIVITGREGTIRWVNPAFTRLTGYTAEEAIGQNPRFLKSGQQEVALYQKLWETILSGQVWQGELVNRRKDGSLYTEEQTITPVRDARGEISHFVAIKQDVTERKSAEEKLRYLSTHDALTGLYNRAFFEEELARLERGRQFPVSVVMADLDGLKAANDSLGHAAGDEMLRQAAQLFKSAFRAEDVAARIGGDEFAALLPLTDAAAREVVIERLRKKIEAYSAARDGPAPSLSLGGATVDKGGRLAQALKEADGRMYQNKSARQTIPDET